MSGSSATPSGGGGAATVLRAPVDASMDLLNQIIRQPYDPDYPVVAARGSRPSRYRAGLAVVLLVCGVMFAVAAVQTNRAAPQAEQQRRELIARVQAAQDRQNQLSDQVAALNAENAELRRAALGNDSDATATQTRLDDLSLLTGATPVTGPGLRIVVDDAPDAAVESTATVTAQDVQVLTNSLWVAGAEAISINGHRLSTLSAIRQAGSALTVDYSSITHPYTIEAIGDPRTFAATYARTAGSDWWQTLKTGQLMRYDVESAETLTLGADPGLTLRYAEVRRSASPAPSSEGPR